MTTIRVDEALSEGNPTRGLTEMQDRFVTAYVMNGGNGTKAAAEAGFSEKSARQQAHALVSKPHVQQAIQIEKRRVLSRLSVKALVILESILDDTRATLAVKLDAVKTCLDRDGLTAKSAEIVAAAGGKRLSEMSIEELEAFITNLEPAQAPPDHPH